MPANRAKLERDADGGGRTLNMGAAIGRARKIQYVYTHRPPSLGSRKRLRRQAQS